MIDYVPADSDAASENAGLGRDRSTVATSVPARTPTIQEIQDFSVPAGEIVLALQRAKDVNP